MADVVVSLSHADVELGVRGNVKAFASARGLPCAAAVQLVFARTTHAFHDFCSGSTKRQCSGQNHADGFLGAIGQGEAVAYALAVKVDVGLGGQSDAGEMLGSHGERAVAGVGSKLSILGYLRHPWGFAKRTRKSPWAGAC